MIREMRYGTIRCDTARHDTTRHAASRRDAPRYDMIRYGTIWYETTRHDKIRYDMTRYQARCDDATRYGMIRRDKIAHVCFSTFIFRQKTHCNPSLGPHPIADPDHEVKTATQGKSAMVEVVVLCRRVPVRVAPAAPRRRTSPGPAACTGQRVGGGALWSAPGSPKQAQTIPRCAEKWRLLCQGRAIGFFVHTL